MALYFLCKSAGKKGFNKEDNLILMFKLRIMHIKNYITFFVI